jgi:transcriptional regulator with XRE-family HTH domain
MIPYWGRLAIADMAARGFTYAELMQLFGVGRSTVSRAIQGDPRGYQPMSGQRVLTDSQKLPLKSSN